MLSLKPFHADINCCAFPQVAKVEKAVLSTTAKAKERQKKKEVEKAEKEKAEGGAAAVKPAEGATGKIAGWIWQGVGRIYPEISINVPAWETEVVWSQLAEYWEGQ
jgi:hypothetical protein